ncbi:MAG: hypothetical protein JOZ43_06065 [Acidobacteriales bacterium]|nr:hypothetical protein [Terriglobales bacterium]
MKYVSNLRALFCGLVLTCALNAQSTQSATNTSHTNGEMTSNALSPAIVLSEPSRGVVFKTAAINSNGTVATCFRCNPAGTVRLGVGEYQVSFNENVEAAVGFSRWVQVDTLTTGSANAWCTTADRLGVANAIFVSCQAPGGPGSMGNSKAVDTSFFLFVAR